MDKKLIKQALAIKILQKKYKPQRESLVEFMKFIWESEKKTEFDIPPYYYDMQDKLNKMLKGEMTRLIINVPPRSGKTLMITEMFPVWAMGNHPSIKFIVTGYSTSLTREFSGHSRDWYQSNSYNMVFPERSPMREDQNTKEYWRTQNDCSYFATGAGGSIVGRGSDFFLIDDPIKPDIAETSELQRESINNWYLNTVTSRLNNPKTGCIVIIMQRTHENDLTGFLTDRENKGIGEKWEKIIVPAIDVNGNSLSEKRFPIEVLSEMKRTNPVVFSCQYQQEPINRETQEFHEEWLRFFDNAPESGRLFAMLDPANQTGNHNDESAILVGRVCGSDLYIEEILSGRWTATELEDKCLYIGKKWQPSKFGIEAYAAQVWVGHSIQNRFKENNINSMIENVIQKGSKEDKIRSVINPIRNGKLYFKRGMDGLDRLIDQMRKFPRGIHDDILDGLQMLYFLCDTQPNINLGEYNLPKIEYTQQGQPVYRNNDYDNRSWLK